MRIVEELHDCLEVLAAAPPAPWKERVAALRGLQALAESGIKATVWIYADGITAQAAMGAFHRVLAAPRENLRTFGCELHPPRCWACRPGGLIEGPRS